MSATAALLEPARLQPSFREKIWGSTRLEPWFPNTDRKIGEVWFEHAGPLPLLVKFLFTSDRLSVQVHPDDEYAAKHENSRGKTEMWHVLRAEPGAQIAVGLREKLTRERLRDAALSGEIEHFLNWTEVQPGQTIFIPAGTVHAIGAGLALCEIQQYSDITYRLYDYGRPRELHLARAEEVAIIETYQAPPAREGYLVDCPYFAVQQAEFSRETLLKPRDDRLELLVILEGEGDIGGRSYCAGETWLIPAGGTPFTVGPRVRTCALRAFARPPEFQVT
jgi:mannose-6-phosphate isomerase